MFLLFVYVCIPRSFLVISVCNQGRTLCSPCRYLVNEELLAKWGLLHQKKRKAHISCITLILRARGGQLNGLRKPNRKRFRPEPCSNKMKYLSLIQCFIIIIIIIIINHHHHHPLCRVSIHIFLRQTMSLGNTVLQLF
jgi:hypothetical protein